MTGLTCLFSESLRGNEPISSTICDSGSYYLEGKEKARISGERAEFVIVEAEARHINPSRKGLQRLNSRKRAAQRNNTCTSNRGNRSMRTVRGTWACAAVPERDFWVCCPIRGCVPCYIILDKMGAVHVAPSQSWTSRSRLNAALCLLSSHHLLLPSHSLSPSRRGCNLPPAP